MNPLNSRVKSLSLAAVFGCGLLLLVGAATAQQPIAPTGTLEVAPATIVEAQPNYGCSNHSLHARFRSARPWTAPLTTLRRRGQTSTVLEQRSRSQRYSLPWHTPVIVMNFNAHSATEGSPAAGHTWRGGYHSFCPSNQQPYRHVDKTEHPDPAVGEKRDARDLLQLHRPNALRSACGL